MKFTQHLDEARITEKSSDIQVLDFINKKCKPFVKDFKRVKKSGLFSGRKHTKPVYIKTVNKDRHPMDTPVEIQVMMDDYFESVFNVRIRAESIFVTGKITVAKNYGRNVYLIIPISKYEVYWSKTYKDLYSEVMENNQSFEDWYTNDMYDERFGEGEQGTWYSSITGDNHSDKESAAQEAYEEMWREYNWWDDDNEEWEKLHPDEDPPDEPDMGYYDIIQTFEWEPSMTEEDFMEDMKREWEDEQAQVFSLAVDEYQAGDLKGAIESQHEIHLVCDTYLALRYDRFVEIKNDKQLKNYMDDDLRVGNRILYYLQKWGGVINDPRQLDLF